MKKSSIVLALSLITVTACNSNEEASREAHKDHASTKPVDSGSVSPGVQLKNQPLDELYAHYSKLTTALVNADASEARVAAAAIEAGAKQVTGAEKIASASSKIVSAADVDAQRNAFSPLSDELIKLVKQSGVQQGELYVDYCPMAMNDKGAYWLSSEKEIINPYFGDKMLSCGEVKETLK